MADIDPVATGAISASTSSEEVKNATGTRPDGSQSAEEIKLNNLEDLRTKAPQVYQALVDSIMQRISSEQAESVKRMKENLRQK